MSWMKELYKTYENCINKVDLEANPEKAGKPLLPPFHSLQNSHLEIKIDGYGNFLDANPVIEKKDREIIIPCTEKSASRTSGEEPHPLCDKIQYCAKDYSGNKKQYFKTYFKLLESWKNFDSSNKFLNAIYIYVEKGTIGILHEQLLAMIVEDLKYKSTLVPSRETAVAITKLQEALFWLEEREKDREARKVLGTYNK